MIIPINKLIVLLLTVSSFVCCTLRLLNIYQQISTDFIRNCDLFSLTDFVRILQLHCTDFLTLHMATLTESKGDEKNNRINFCNFRIIMTDENNRNVKEIRELYSMFHQEYIIMAEYRMLQTENLQGIYVIPSYENSFLWFGVVFVRAGFYEGGVFRFTLTLPEKFPDDEVPVLTFSSHLYHPAVDPNTGVLNLSEVFPQWDRKRNHVWQILKYVHWIFHNLNLKVPANVEASVNYRTNRKQFLDKVRECVVSSIDHVYDDPPTEDKHYITFKPYDPEVHDSAKNLMLQPPKSNEGLSQGISWVQPGSYQPFSKEENT